MIAIGLQDANDSDNIKKEIAINIPASLTVSGFLAVINALPLFKISETELPIFKAITTDLEPVTYYVELLNVGKGTYGTGGLQLTPENVRITSSSATSTDIVSLPNTQIIDLGYIGDNVVWGLNIQVPNIVIQEQNEGYVLVKGIFENGEYHEYLWIGTGGAYGQDGGLQATGFDLKEMSSVTSGIAKATSAYSGTVKTDTDSADPTVYIKETVDNLLGDKANVFTSIKTIVGATYNPILEDLGSELLYDGITAINVVIPTNLSIPFPVGTSFYSLATNTGVLSISAAPGVVLKYKVGLPLSAIQNELRKYTKIAINTWSVDGNVPSSSDMILASTQTVSGLKTFLNSMFGLRNVANTFTAFFTNSNTASRTYTLQDRSGTVADLQDVGTKMNIPTGGEVDYLPKFLTNTTQGKSVLREVLGKLGIGTINKPNSDITFGRQINRTIEIEQSPNTVSGRDLIVSAGRTINYVEGTGFQRIYSGLALNFTGIIVEPISQNLYVSSTSGIFKKIASGAFANEFAGISDFARGLGYDNVGNIYVANATGGFVKKTISTGVWAYVTATGVTGVPLAIGGNSIGDLYMGTNDGVFKQTGGTGNFVKIFTGDVRVISISPVDNSVYISVASNGGTVYKQTGGVGAFDFIQVLGGYLYNVCCLNSGDVLVSLNDAVYKQTAQQGLFVITTITTTTNLEFLAGDINSSVYAIRDNDDIYFLDNNAVGTPNLDGGTKSERAGTGKGTGKSRWDVWTGQKTASGTNMQAITKRVEVDELGAFKLLTTHQYADNATAINAGLGVGSLYWNANGDLKIVI